MNNKVRVLVTGGSGFMGGHLIPLLLQKGYDVLSLDKDINTLEGDFKSVICNILNAKKLDAIFNAYKPNIVVHLAARVDLFEKENIAGYADNIDGVRNLVESINSSGSVERLLVTSSQLVSRIGYKQKHDYDYSPNNLYGESKVLTEKIIRESNMPGVDWCILRPTTIWGEGMSSHYQKFLRMVLDSNYFHVGGNRLYKSYGYIGNSVYQYLKFIEAENKQIHSKVFYIADYDPLSLVEWADSFARHFKVKKIRTLPLSFAKIVAYIGDLINFLGFKKFPFNSFRLNNVLTEYIFDMSKTKNIVGELPYTVEDGVDNTANWFLSLEDNQRVNK